MTAPSLRRADWPERMAALIEERRLAPFAWGTNDCTIFAADMLRAMCDIDVASHLRGQYSTALQAQRILDEEGGVYGLATAILGEPRANRLLAQRGDVVLVRCDERDTLAIVTGTGHWCAPGAEGLVFRPIDEALLAWEV